MATARYLIDNSALVRVAHPVVQRAWTGILEAGMVGVCPVTELEFRYSSRSLEDYEIDRDLMADLYAWFDIPDSAWRRAAEVQYEMVRRGTHRSAGLPDLVLAATAETHGLTVLHYDADYDTIAEVTGQPTEWIAPRGSAN